MSLAQTPAADLRTHLDLLLGEHVMIVAKESSAAVNHSDEYAAYTALLAANSTDLATLFGRAFGATAASQLGKSWETQNGYLVDYAIRVASHDDDKANAATAALTGTFPTQFGQVIAASTGIAANVISDLAHQQVLLDKAFVDDVAAQRFASFYTDLDKAYQHSSQLGDVLARRVAARFPDRFPGDPSARAAESRVELNLMFQEHSYLATMATDSAVTKRASEKSAAVAALASNGKALQKAWSDWDAAIVAYAMGGDLDGAGHVDTLMSASGAPITAVRHYVDATARVIDDQRSQPSKTLADDDRAAATATQPIADAAIS